MNNYMIIDGQWGSTGKGLIAGYLAMHWMPDAVVCNFGPNAGHTVVFEERTVMTQILPTAIISPSVMRIFIGPGAIVDPAILRVEIEKYADLLEGKKILVHESASIVTELHKATERAELTRISSTCKGTGASQVDKMMRIPEAVAGGNLEWMKDVLGDYGKVVTAQEYEDSILFSKNLQIESAQGFELGINTGWFPHCTSRDVNVWQVLSDCAIPRIMAKDIYVIVSMRTFPIRVGNVKDDQGKMIGYSGDVYPDQKEITFEELGVEAERTTVTQKIRRIFTWSSTNMQRVKRMINPDAVFLNFVNYLEDDPSFKSPETERFVNRIEHETGMKVSHIGTGPAIEDVKYRMGMEKRG
jgi:adenylosuccinate synthase